MVESDFSENCLRHLEKHDAESFMGIRMIEKLVEDIVYRKVFGVNTLIIRLGIVK